MSLVLYILHVISHLVFKTDLKIYYFPILFTGNSGTERHCNLPWAIYLLNQSWDFNPVLSNLKAWILCCYRILWMPNSQVLYPDNWNFIKNWDDVRNLYKRGSFVLRANKNLRECDSISMNSCFSYLIHSFSVWFSYCPFSCVMIRINIWVYGKLADRTLNVQCFRAI